MKINVSIFICLLLIAVPLRSYGQEYSLDELFMLSLERSETIKIAEEDLSIAELNRKKAISVFIPTFSAFANHTNYTEAKSSPFGLLQPDYTNQWGLSIEKTFSFSGRELIAYSVAKDNIEKGRYSLQAAKEKRLLDVAGSYFNVMKSKKAREIASANVERLQKHRDASKTRVEVGDATKTSLLRAEAELAGARSELITAENTVLLLKSVLASLVGIKGDISVKEPQLPADSDGKSIINEITENCVKEALACLKDRARDDRAEIRSLNIGLSIAEKEVKYNRGSYWPKLTLEGVYFREENEPARSFELNESIYGAIRFDFPFYEGGLRMAEVAEAKAKLRQAEYIAEDSTRLIDIEIEDAYLNLTTVSSIINQLKAEVTYATANFTSVEKQFQHGLADSIDVIDANTLLVTAERKLSNAQYDYQYAIINLKRAAGVLLKSIETGQSAGIKVERN
jgi:outer membrane protein